MVHDASAEGNSLVALAASLRDWALAQWEVSLLLVCFAFFRWWWSKSYAEEQSRAGIINFLNHAQAANAYKLLVGWLLGAVDRWGLAPGDLALRPQARPALSSGFYTRCLLLALVYSTLAVYATWPFTGTSVRFGGERYLYAAGHIGRHWTFLALGSCAVWAAAAFLTARGATVTVRLAWWALAVAAAILTASVQTLAVRISGYGAGASLLLVAMATAVALDRRPAVQATAALTGVVAATGFLKLLQIPGAPSVLSEALRSALGFAGLGDLPGGVDGRLLRFAIEQAIWSAACTALAVVPLRRLAGAGTLSVRYLVSAWIGFVALALALAWLTPWRGYVAQLRLIILLPLVNAVFDVASIGLTRWTLRRGIRHIGWPTLYWSLVDIVGAIGLFLALGWALVTVLILFDLAVGFPMTDLVSFFSWWRTEPLSHLWLALAVGTTLLPTLAHAMIAVWAIGPAVFGFRIRRWLASKLEIGGAHFGWRWLVLSTLSVWSAAAVAVPIILLLWLGDWIAREHPAWGIALLGFFETAFIMLSGTGS